MTADRTLDRKQAVPAVIGDPSDLLIVAGLAGTAKDIGALTQESSNVYLMGGAMGAAVPFALGLAHAQPARRVLAVTGRSGSLPAAELDEAAEIAGFLGVRHEVIDTREMERPGYRANAGDRCYHCRIELFGLRQAFSFFLSSCYLGVRKPEEAIYRMAIDITQGAPEECVFIDDRSLNLECANLLGITGIRFTSAAQLESDLANLGVAA